MPTPEFVKDLRRGIGTKEMWLPGVSAVVVRRQDEYGAAFDVPQVLLVQRSDNEEWTVTSGILELGEDPAPAGVREVHEETGVRARPVRLAGVWTMPLVTYAHGDNCRYLDTVMEFEWISGVPRVNDDESVDAGWFSLSMLPEGLSQAQKRKIDWAADFGSAAKFMR
ncbi:MAG: NUDIX hydrolase [Nesterenkonia sp.]